MKNYTITVNGNVYDVTVEEGASTGAAPVKAAPQAPKAAPKAAAPAGAAGSVTVVAPMPGKILSVKASVGQAVKKGEVILVLEAMKMENDIVAPQDGTIATINAAAGESVEAGAVIATLN
ncbi:MAG: biotin/lipoyl-binding protein [Lachnospiraceae bacterium]|nr:biotin/lipoyl-binding protein [Lachnospiraceae bacterium]